MKKSFKKVVAILLAVLMMVCSFPLTALAAGGTRANIKLQFGSVTNSASNIKNYAVDRNNSVANFSKYTGMNSNELTYSNGAISGYETGDFFTISVLVENISQISATEIAVKYSDAIEPAFLKNSGSPAPAVYTDSAAAYTGFGKLEAITAQSGNAIYNTTSTVGETSYIDAEKRVMHANFAVQTGADAIDLTKATSAGKYSLTNSAIIATFMFKIVNSNAITFSIDTASDTYYLNTIANGGSVNEYKTYAPKVDDDASTAELDFMGKNEHVGSTTQTYTIRFVDADGKQISSAQYEEGAAVIAPQLPAVTHDDAQHYTYAWDKEIPATATADGTYTIIKTGAAHTWDAGVTTKEPTATETGIKTFTCTFNGCGATRTEELPKTEVACQHEYVWTYNKDAYRDSNKVEHDGTETGVCSKCGDTITRTAVGTGSLRATTYNLTLSAGIAVNFKTKTTTVNKFDKVWCEVEKFDASTGKYMKPEVIEDSFVDGNNTAFRFTKIAPQTMADNMIVKFCAERDGITYEGTITTQVNVRSYVMGQLNKQTSKTSAATLFVDMLNYGTAAQDYMSYNQTDYINSQLTDVQKSWATPLIANDDYVNSQNLTYVVCENPQAAWRTAALRLESSVDFKLSFSDAAKTDTLTDISNIKIKVQLEDGTIKWFDPINNPESFEPYKTSSQNVVKGRWYFTTSDIPVANLVDPVYLTICDANGNPISNTFRYSAETFVKAQQGKAIKDTLDHMMVYAKAAYNYNLMGGK
ncbi:hypothetical protein [uncultured Eubacterium sp.]|uniref:hypothetical protein n=1 Tax=uncultured Eubacterium sp. TaxID=165185 RepID=UPI0025F8C1B2|nr:hypothetical protein [uncultured Eubacterium sp.]